MRLGARVGRGCGEIHDRLFVGPAGSGLDEVWGYVRRKRRQHPKPGKDGAVTGDQYTADDRDERVVTGDDTYVLMSAGAGDFAAAVNDP
jgi:hypothetical protein